MVVDKKEFQLFLESIGLCRDFEITDLVIDIDKSMELVVVDKTRIVGIKAKFNNVKEQLGSLGIGDLKLLRGFINSFQDDEIKIEKKDNKLILSSDKDSLKVRYMLTNPEYIKNNLSKENQKTFNSQLTELKKESAIISPLEKNKLVKYLSSFKSDLIRLKSDGKQVDFSVEKNEHGLVASTELNRSLDKVVIDVSSIFVDILKYHDGEYSFNLQDKKPIYLGFQTDYCSVDYLIAPSLVEGD